MHNLVNEKGFEMMRSAWLVLIVAGAAGVARAEPPAPPKVDFDPLDCRWTFGNHEPIAMYRRAGNRVTGGIEGGALWLEDWHHWFDSEASTRLMEELGLNILHCRFYKGMGWQFESRDFPNVKRFVENCHVPPCYCPRCTALFREHLAKVPDPERRFGIPTVEHVLLPVRAGYGEIQDPLCQEWIRFRCERLTALFRRLYLHAKACKPSAIVSGNIQNVRRANMAATAGLIATDLEDCFDVFVSQSGNAPGLADGCVVNRVREMKLCQSLGTHVLALCDSDAGVSPEAESAYVLTLVEDAVFGGIPSDRTVMKPAPEMVSARVVEFRRPLLRRFDEAVRSGRAGLKRPTHAPVRLLYSRESEAFSEQSHRAVLGAEEVLLRNQVPYGLLPTDAATPLRIPADCDLLLVCDQRCLGDAQLDAPLRFADGGGRLVITGQSGEHDESYRQRRDNPLECLDGRSKVVRRAEVDVAPVKSGGWTIKVAAPVDGGRRLMDDLASVWSPAIRIEAPDTVFAEVKRDQQGFSVHLVNYAREPAPQGARIEIRADVLGALYCTFAAPMESRSAQPVAAKMDALGRWAVDLPPFAVYAVVDLLDPGHMSK